MNKIQKPSWFSGKWYDKGDIVKSHKNQKEYKLNASQLSVYDQIGNLDIIISMISDELDSKTAVAIHKIKTEYRMCIDWFFHNDAKLASELFSPKVVFKYKDDIEKDPNIMISRVHKDKKIKYNTGAEKTPIWVFLIGVPVVWMVGSGLFFLIKFLIDLF